MKTLPVTPKDAGSRLRLRPKRDSGLLLQDISVVAYGPHIVRPHSPPIKDAGAAALLSRPSAAIPLYDDAGITHRPDVVGIGPPDTAQVMGCPAGLYSPGRTVPADNGSPLTDRPDVVGAQPPDGDERVGCAAGLRTPGRAVPFQNHSDRPHGPHIVRISPPDALKRCRCAHGLGRPGGAVPLEDEPPKSSTGNR